MPSPTVLYVVATIVIALLFVWVGLVSKSRTVAWEATPEERARFAKLRPFAEGDFAGVAEPEEAPAATEKPKRKKAKAKGEEPAVEASKAGEVSKAEESAEEVSKAEESAEEASKAEDGEKSDGAEQADEKSDKSVG